MKVDALSKENINKYRDPAWQKVLYQGSATTRDNKSDEGTKREEQKREERNREWMREKERGGERKKRKTYEYKGRKTKKP